ncbi:MAG: gfo/Idh/MocA family oxidoreductase [bacterium]|nr:gfo/Idh/MocA family oxidoreductase [bacterium]
MSKYTVSRRFFLMGAAAGMAGCATSTVPSLKRMGYKSPNEKLNLAAIGAGGKGASDIQVHIGKENIIALCDADWRRAADSFRKCPDARKYKDFREMLDSEPTLDGVTVSTPDHMHAVAAMACMKRGLGVYVQKPLTHDIFESRQLQAAAHKYGVVTQMGNQGHSGDGVRECCEMIWDGAIGDVREVHSWTNRPIWPQGIQAPLDPEPIPEEIDWDLWLGTAPWRPFNHGYAPFNWRGWWDFGTGALGDMACHILDAPNWALMLGYPSSVECVYQEGASDQSPPTKSKIKYEFPARGSMPPVTLYWYDGGLMPERPKEIDPDAKLGDGDNGSLFVGDKGYITTRTYGEDPTLHPAAKFKDYKRPAPYIPRIPNHHFDWTNGIKGGPKPCSNFDYAAPFAEVVLLGNLAIHCPGQKLLWDGPNMRVTNYPEANQYVKRTYRKGWSL